MNTDGGRAEDETLDLDIHDGRPAAEPETEPAITESLPPARQATVEATVEASSGNPGTAVESAVGEASDAPTVQALDPSSTSPNVPTDQTRDDQPETEDEVVSGDADLPSNGSLLFLTNRFNLVTLLGARMILAREGFRKYYPDLLARAPGHVPLLAQAPTAELISEVVGTAPNNFPVLIEIADRLRQDREPSDGGVFFADAPIPWELVEAIHFPTERAMKEHAARPYGNVHPHDELLRVTPELFAGSEPSVVWPAGTDSEPADAPDWNKLDRARGALNALRAASASPDALRRFAQVLTGDIETQPEAEWFAAVAGLLPRPERGAARRGRAAAKPEQALFSAALEELIETDVQADWSPRTVAQRISDRAAASATVRMKPTLAKNLEHVHAVVSGERDFTPFKAGGTGLVTAKALLLVLLREDLGSLLSWPTEETNADPLVMQTAAVFAGALRGLAREQIEFRDRHFDDLTSRLAAGWDLGEVTVEESDGDTALAIDGVRIVTVEDHPQSVEELLSALPEELRLAQVQRICAQMAWNDVLVTTVEWGDDCVVSIRDGRSTTRGSALNISVEIDEDRLATHLAGETLDDALLAQLRAV